LSHVGGGPVEQLAVNSGRPSEPRALTSWRVLLVVVAAVVATVLAGVVALQQEIRSRTLDSAVHGVVILSSLVIDRSLTLHDITDRLHPENHAALDADVVLLQAKDQLLGLTMWSMADGHLVYADPDHQDAGWLSEERRAAVRADRPVATPAVDADTGAQVLEVHYPYDANGDGRVDALAVALLPRQGVDRSIAQSTRMLYAGALFVFLVAVVGVLQVRRRQIAQDHAAVHDWLTGLGNRERLRRLAAPAVEGATRARPLTLLLLDLNGFKGVNDSLGHQAGDQLLIEVAKRLREVCGADGTPIRLGGDEFAVLLPKAGAGAAMTLGRDVRAAVRRPVLIDEVAVAVDASIGIAHAPGDGTDLSTLLHAADLAMYRAKKAGGGVLAYDRAWATEEAAATPGELPDLRRALAEDRLELRYRVAAGALEAVPHWRYSRHGLHPATDFLAAARYTPMLRTLTSWVLHTAAADCAAWRAAGHPVTVAVHLPAPAAGDPELPGLLGEAVRAAGLPAAAVRPEFGAAPADDEPALPPAEVPARLAALGTPSDDREVVPR
jgi:diguanylate cyclase (GGDEF)-like protein